MCSEGKLERLIPGSGIIGTAHPDATKGVGRIERNDRLYPRSGAISAHIGTTMGTDGTMMGVIGLITDGNMIDAHMCIASECQCLSKVGFGFYSVLLLDGGDCQPFGLSRFSPRRESCP